MAVSCWMLALKRYLRPGKLSLLVLMALMIVFGRSAGRQAALRPCGLYCEDPHPTAQAVQADLLGRGFAAYHSREEMEEDISMGILDCGAVLQKGIGEAVDQADYAGFVTLLAAPDSFLTEAYEAHITAALYTAAAPALIRQASTEAGVPLEDAAIQKALGEMMAEGYRFTFDIVTTRGTPPATRDLGQAIALAAAALLLFAAVVPGTVGLVRDAERLWNRIGGRAARLKMLLPGICWQTLVCSLAAGLALGKGGWAIPGYVLILTALGLVIARLPVNLKPLLPLVLLGSLALLPIYYDLAGLYPQLVLLQRLLVPCWLPGLTEHPLPGAMIGIAATAVLISLYPKRRQV